MVQKCLLCRACKKTNRALIHELEGSHFDLLIGRDRFSCRGPGTGTNHEKRVNRTRNSVRKFQPGKRARLFRFSTFSENFPVGRTDETCSIYRRTGNSGNFENFRSCSGNFPVGRTENSFTICIPTGISRNSW